MAYVIKQNVPPGREQSLALTELEKVMFRSNAGIARHRGQRLKDLEHERRLAELTAKAQEETARQNRKATQLICGIRS